MSNEYKCYTNREIDTNNKPSIHIYFLESKKLNIYEFPSTTQRDEIFLKFEKEMADDTIKIFKSFWRDDRQKHTIELEGKNEKNCLKQLKYINSIKVEKMSIIKCDKKE